MTKIFLIIIFTGFYIQSIAQTSDEELVTAIKLNDVGTVDRYFRSHKNTNRPFGRNNVSLLHYAASLDKPEIIEILINYGFNADELFKDETPLMVATFNGNVDAVDLLLKKGANINFQNSKGETVAILAAKFNEISIVELLKKNGADFSMQDTTKNSAIDYAFKYQNIDSYKLLTDLPGNKYEKKHLPNYFDGPYVFRIGKSKLKITYLLSDSVKNSVFSLDSVVKVGKAKIELNKKGQEFEIKINPEIGKKRPEIISNVKKMLAIGDLHGGFDVFKSFLINNKVVDKDCRWIFGDGHLVIIGDVFDRGNKVTECFWLLYNLESEALLQNGQVHLVLGNHEIMEFLQDKRYLNDKYLDLFNHLKINYSNFYGINSELGKWLRNQNAVIKLNDMLFVHGGISHEVIDKKLNIKSINNSIREIINRPGAQTINETEEFLIGSSGPLWYRGYLKLSNKYYKSTHEKFDFDEQKLDDILKFYKVQKIVFANTDLEEVTPMYHNKLIGIDIPFAERKIELQGLYYDGKDYYKAHADGHLDLIK